MSRLLDQVVGVLRLARVTTAFAAIANVWFVILWTHAHAPAEEPWIGNLREGSLWLPLLGGALTAIGLYAFGASLNDVIDISRDRALRRDRPIPEGRTNQDAATFAVAATLIIAVLGSTAFGTPSILLTLAIALGILVFNALGKWVPAVGMPLLATLYAGHMLVPNPKLQFLWPVWLVMTHAIVVAGLTHWIARKTPPISRRAAACAILGWAIASAAIIYTGARRAPARPTETIATQATGTQSADPTPPTPITDPITLEPTLWPDWVPIAAAIAPLALLIAYAALVIRRVRTLGMGPRTAEKINRYGALWLALYGCAWLYATRNFEEALILTALTAAGVIGMTVLRETYNLIEHPLAYRR